MYLSVGTSHHPAPNRKSGTEVLIQGNHIPYAAKLLDFRDPAGRERLREKLEFEIVVADPGFFSPFELAQNGGRWRPVYADNQAAVFVDTQGENWQYNSGRL